MSTRPSSTPVLSLCVMPNPTRPLPPPVKHAPSSRIHTTAVEPIDHLSTFLIQKGLPRTTNSFLVYQVHEDLLHVRKWKELHVRATKGSTLVFLTGFPPIAHDSLCTATTTTKTTRHPHIVVPMRHTNVKMTPRNLYRLQEQINSVVDYPVRCMTLAIVTTDSTTSYYRVTNQWDEITREMESKTEGEDGGDDAASGGSETD